MTWPRFFWTRMTQPGLNDQGWLYCHLLAFTGTMGQLGLTPRGHSSSGRLTQACSHGSGGVSSHKSGWNQIPNHFSCLCWCVMTDNVPLVKISHIGPNPYSRSKEIDSTSWLEKWHSHIVRGHACRDGRNLWPFAIYPSHKISKWPNWY